MTKGKIIFWSLLLLLIAGLAYVKYTKNKEAESKIEPTGKKGPQTLMASGLLSSIPIIPLA